MRSKPIRIACLVGVLAVAATWVTFAVVTRPGAQERFCTLGLSVVEVDGVPYAYEDQGAPGKDGCDGDEVLGGAPPDGFGDGWVGFDCRIHDGSDVTDDTVMLPKRADGTCGQTGP